MTDTSISPSPSKSDTLPKTGLIHEDPSVLTTSMTCLKSLVMWENTVHSGIVAVSSISLILASRYLSDQILPLTFTSLYWITLLNLVLKGAAQVVQATTGTDTLPNMYRLIAPRAQIRLTDLQAKKVASIIVTAGNAVLRSFISIVLVNSIPSSMLGLVGIYFGTYITSWFAPSTLLLMGTIAAFSFPILYHQNRALIDSHCDAAIKLGNTYFGSVLEATKSMRSDLISKISSLTSAAASAAKTKAE